MSRVQDTANQAREFVTERMGDVTESMSRVRDQVSDTVSRGMDRVRSMDRPDVDQMYDDVLESARANPGRTILISAAVGMVLGMMMRGGNRRDY